MMLYSYKSRLGTQQIKLTLRKRQEGIVLLVGLIFLVVLALLAVGAAQVTILEEKLSGNVRNRAISHQAMEAAVREAELMLENTESLSGKGYSTRIDAKGNSASFWSGYDWTGSSFVVATRMINSAQPAQYVIEYARKLATDPNQLGEKALIADWQVFRITARGYGLTDSAESFGQASYQKPIFY